MLTAFALFANRAMNMPPVIVKVTAVPALKANRTRSGSTWERTSIWVGFEVMIMDSKLVLYNYSFRQRKIRPAR
jgi:hypothetical protein